MPRPVQLKPGLDAHSQIECVTIPGGAHDLEYTALSYTVPAEDQHQYTITIDGVRHGVSDVLHSALRHVGQGQSGDSPIMWIDPICLDPGNAPQDPLSSLTSQKIIYDNASKIAVWLGEPRQTTPAWFSAMESFTRHGGARSTPKDLLEVMFGNQLFSRTWAWMQPLFRLPWWHWARLEALLALKDPSKVVFCCGSERMSWESFTSVVYILRYALPHVDADYSLWLDQILLQIPGRLPEAFREIFYNEIAATGLSEEGAWGKGVLFAHPQDVHYDMKIETELKAAGRLMTRLSARLANRYRRRCIWELEQRDNADDESEDYQTLGRCIAHSLAKFARIILQRLQPFSARSCPTDYCSI